MKINITLTDEEADLLESVLFSYDDEGPDGEGWQSEQLKKLRDNIAQQIKDNRDQ